MNCKPGDLAVIVYQNRDPLRLGITNVLGRFVDVIGPAPLHDFYLPDGTSHCPGRHQMWVVKFQNPVKVPYGESHATGARSSLYACVPDNKLRPIRDQPGADETLDWAPVPATKALVPA